MRYCISKENKELRDKQAVEDYKNGMKMNHVLHKHRLSWQYFMDLLKANNIPYKVRHKEQHIKTGAMVQKEKIKELDKQIVREYEQGYTVNELAVKYKMGINEVANTLRKMFKKIRVEDKEELSKHRILCHYCEISIWRNCDKRGADVKECKDFKPDHRYSEQVKKRFATNKKGLQ